MKEAQAFLHADWEKKWSYWDYPPVQEEEFGDKLPLQTD